MEVNFFATTKQNTMNFMVGVWNTYPFLNKN